MAQKKLLIIEDDKSLTTLYQQILLHNDLTHQIVHDGHQALDSLEEYKPNVVLLDMHIPLVSGTEILHRIQGHPHCQDADIILASADSALCHKWEHRVHKVFIKPFSISELITAIKELSTADGQPHP